MVELRGILRKGKGRREKQRGEVVTCDLDKGGRKALMRRGEERTGVGVGFRFSHVLVCIREMGGVVSHFGLCLYFCLCFLLPGLGDFGRI